MATLNLKALVVLALATSAGGTNLLITEIADPNDVANSRFVELFSPDGAGTTISDQLHLIRWTNANSAPTTSSAYSLNGLTIASDGFIVGCYNRAAAESSYGTSACDFYSTKDVFNSNGDDNIALIQGDPSSSYTIIDMFGVAGEDGSGTQHEFEDGRAERADGVTAPKASWDATEWNVYSDSGVSIAGVSGSAQAVDASGCDPRAWIGTPRALASAHYILSPASLKPCSMYQATVCPVYYAASMLMRACPYDPR